MKKNKERDKKGRFSKGHTGGPGRPKGEPRDIVCKDGKKRSVATLIGDLLAAYESLGGDKFLRKWALHSHSNLRKFIEILFKFVPQPEVVAGDTNIKVISAVPRVKIERIITDDPEKVGMPRAQEKTINDLQAEIRAKDGEIKHLKALIDAQETRVIEHEPIPPAALPEHTDKLLDELASLSEEELDKRLERMTNEEEKKVYDLLKRGEK